MDLIKELSDHIRARYPMLYLVTSEEGRAMTALADVAKATQKTMWVWSASDGLLDPKGGEIKDAKGEPIVSPLKALRYALRSQERALFVFKDLTSSSRIRCPPT